MCTDTIADLFITATIILLFEHFLAVRSVGFAWYLPYHEFFSTKSNGLIAENPSKKLTV